MGRCLVGVLLAFSIVQALHPRASIAHGALAVALPASVVKGGFSYGFHKNSSASEAREKALKACRTTDDAAKDANFAPFAKLSKLSATNALRWRWTPHRGPPE